MPGQPVVLDTLGGIVVTARPEDIPEGASPRCNDVDFIVGRFIQRPGQQSVYTLAQAEFGPAGGNSAIDISTVGSAWSNPTNILLGNASYAKSTLGSPVATFQVQSVAVTSGGYYSLSQVPSAIISGPGSGATVSLTVVTITPSSGPEYNTVTHATVVSNGIYTGTASVTFTGASSGNNATGTVAMASTSSSSALSHVLQVSGFTFAVPSTYSINGIGVNVKGFAPGATIYAQLLKDDIAVGSMRSAVLPTSDGYVDLGSPLDLWSASWAYFDVDTPSFGVNLWVVSSSSVMVSLDYVEVIIYGAPENANFNGITNANLNETDQTTIALDSNGLSWKEDVTNSPNVLYLESSIPNATAGSYLKGLDANGVAFMAYSDLTQGISQPMQFNGSWCDRITQVGPGQAPTFTPQQTTSDTFSITSISQPAQQNYSFIYFLQSSGPGSTAPGNVVTIYYGDSTVPGTQDTDLVNAMANGQAVYIYLDVTGTPTSFGPLTVQVTAIGEASPPGQPRQFFYFTFNVTTSAYTYYKGSGHPGYAVAWTRSLATMQTAVPVPGLTVGNQITISGNSQTGYNSVWTISQTLDSGEMAITSTSVTSGIATYNYAVQTGANPATGELVTVTNTTNANGALNVTNAAITGVTGGSTGSFTVDVPVATNYANTPESGDATTAGTSFTFDPGQAVVNTSTNPIIGTGTGGALTFESSSAQFITPGVKQGSVFFITRNGAVTRPAPPVQFTVPSNCGAILISGIVVGPPDVLYRGIALTESGQNGTPGESFYFYDTPVTYTVNGTSYTSDALIIRDNTSTSATIALSDTVLLASDEIDIPGNDYFNLIELGNPAWMFQYANRMLYGLCQNKIQNFLNLSFDGGYLPTGSSALPLPAGWQTLGNYGTGVTVGLVDSLDFGNAFQVINGGSSPLTNATLIFQPAYQDYLNVNIVQPNTAYSLRVKARSINANSQQITIQLPTYAAGAFGSVLYGSVTLTFNEGIYSIQTVPFIQGSGLATVPSTLQLAVGVNALAVGAGIEIDRIEIFPTNDPVNTTTIWTSYANQFEAVDINTGTLGVGAENSQPATGAFEILEQLYIEKTKSLQVTQDSPNYEPNNWQVRQASDRAGAVGPNAFDEGEEFAISASRNGMYFFDGGKPMPISRELQSSGTSANLWETINWAAGNTLWVRNDLTNRRLLAGLPMITPNFWLPKASALTPSSPNVILMCNYTGCPTGEELADASEVHVTMFGDLKALDMRRKWSLWQIPCPVAEFVPRQDSFSDPLFLCNGIASGKIYQLVNGAASGGQNTDDGAAINWSYTSYGLVKSKQGQVVPGLGALRKVWYYLAATMEGIGQISAKLYSNSLGALPQNTFTIPLPFSLSYPAQNDQERVIEIGGQRLFIEFSSIGTGGYAEVGPVMVDGEMDKNAPHRGVSA